jgi:FkbM family methyltransferase
MTIAELATKLVDTPYGQFHVWPKDSVGAAIARNEFWDRHLKPVFDEVPPGKTVVDVGANMGLFTVYLAKRGCKVVAFEPCEETFTLLRQNVKLNGVDSLVELHNVALYDHVTTLAFNAEVFRDWYAVPMVNGDIDFGAWAHASGFALAPDAGSSREYKTQKLDFYELDDVYLIKSDAQGCDLRVLKGARDTIRRCEPVLIYELEPPLCPYHGDLPDDYYKFVDDIGYEPTLLSAITDQFYDFVARKRNDANISERSAS